MVMTRSMRRHVADMEERDFLEMFDVGHILLSLRKPRELPPLPDSDSEEEEDVTPQYGCFRRRQEVNNCIDSTLMVAVGVVTGLLFWRALFLF
jgi:hypothetical protein